MICRYKREFIVTGVLKLINTCVQFFPSILIARLLQLVAQGGKDSALASSQQFLRKGVLLSFLLFVVLSTKTIFENAYFNNVINLAANVRGALSTAIYRKSLRLNPQGRQNFTAGEIANYIQLDTNRLEQVAGSIHTVWDGILQIVGYTSLLLAFLGPSVFAGIAALMIMIPLNAYFLTKLSTLRSINLQHTDHRVKLTNEILQGIRAIKSYNWEFPFLAQITNIRDEEIRSMKISANTRAILVSILSAAPSFVAVFTLSLYAILGNTLTPTKVFTALALFNQLRFPVIFFPLLLNTLADGKVSLRRISGFLGSSELQNYISNSTSPSNSIEIESGKFAWSSSSAGNEQQSKEQSNRMILNQVNLQVKKGELVAIVGPVGSGKSMIISALLGELALLDGRIAVNGKVAYVPQSAWIPNNSLRDVILFGRKYEPMRYINAIRSCGLIKDLSDLDDGDETEIGERGVNLSGGQKQRISIARAVYEDADIYLLDDPLSALDADVGQKVFESCVKGVLRSKTRILITHQLRILPQVDRIIVMNTTADGRGCEIIDQGSLQELYSRGYDLSKLVRQDEEDKVAETLPSPSSQLVSEPNGGAPGAALADLANQSKEDIVSSEAVETISSSTDDLLMLPVHGPPELVTSSSSSDAILPAEYSPTHASFTPNVTPDAPAVSSTTKPTIRRRLPGSSLPIPNAGAVMPKRILASSPAASKPQSSSKAGTPPVSSSTTAAIAERGPKKLMTTEERGEGAVSWAVYRHYIKSAKSPLLIAMMIISFMLANAAQIGQLWIVSAWTSDMGYKRFPLAIYLLSMSMAATGVALFNWARTYFAYIIGANASKQMHYEMARRVLRAPLSFFGEFSIIVSMMSTC
jgi:ABC-type multidrug transport system fused ATPase/permease subunit